MLLGEIAKVQVVHLAEDGFAQAFYQQGACIDQAALGHVAKNIGKNDRYHDKRCDHIERILGIDALEAVYLVVKEIFEKGAGKRKRRGMGIFLCLFGRYAVEQEIEQWDDKGKLENAEKHRDQCKNKERENIATIRLRIG